MITTEMILSLRWEHLATNKNGLLSQTHSSPTNGSKTFNYINDGVPYVIYSSADNFIYESRNDPRQWEIKLWAYNSSRANLGDKKTIYEGTPKDIKELKRILVETGADKRWISELRDDKLDILLEQ